MLNCTYHRLERVCAYVVWLKPEESEFVSNYYVINRQRSEPKNFMEFWI